MSSSKQEIDHALLDVRKAYRLLHDYQKAALDAAKYVGAQMGFTYCGGYPLFSDCAPKAGKGSLESWAWDWLNLVFYDFHFTKKVGEKELLNLCIRLFSDTGYFISDDAALVKTEVATFAAVERAGTKVGFLLYREWKPEFELLVKNREVVRRFIEKDGELPDELKDAGLLVKCYDFSRLADEESTDRLIEEVVQMARSNGFPLQRTKKSV